jgi:hypothetical protein
MRRSTQTIKFEGLYLDVTYSCDGPRTPAHGDPAEATELIIESVFLQETDIIGILSEEQVDKLTEKVWKQVDMFDDGYIDIAQCA